MPIQVKDYAWEETEEIVLISVPLKGVPSNRVDVFSVDDYIKVCFNSDDVLLTYNIVKRTMYMVVFLILIGS